MGEPLERSDQYSRRVGAELARNHSDGDESADVGLWDRPGRDDVVSEAESDRLDPRTPVVRTAELWTALALSSGSRF